MDAVAGIKVKGVFVNDDGGTLHTPTPIVIPAKAGLQYAAASRFIAPPLEYWIIRFRG
jgi:hypothetical protein